MRTLDTGVDIILEKHHNFVLDCKIVDYIFIQVEINNFVLVIVDQNARVHIIFYALSRIEGKEVKIYNLGERTHQMKYKDFVRNQEEKSYKDSL